MAKNKPVVVKDFLGYEQEQGRPPVQSRTVMGTFSVNPFERRVLPSQSEEVCESHLDEGLKGFFGNGGHGGGDSDD